MKKSLLSVLLLAAAAAFAEPFSFEPPLPDSASSVALRVTSAWRDSCLPRNARVTREANHIEVLWTTPLSTCVAVLSFWEDLVPLGVLQAGTYDVALRVEMSYDKVDLPVQKLIVAEGVPAFRISPSFASTRGGSQVRLAPTDVRNCSSLGPATVVVDGASVPGYWFGCSLLVTLPPHAAGTVDVTLEGKTVGSTLRYLDPAEAPDPAVFERILIPVLFSGPGAYGSQWMTEGGVVDMSFEDVPLFSDIAQCAGCPTALTREVMPLQLLGNRPNGVFLFVPRTMADSVSVGAIARDASRASVSSGAELPIARERDFRTHVAGRRNSLVIQNVLIDRRYRATLRIYGLDGAGELVAVNEETGTGGAIFGVRLNGPCKSSPCNSAEPAFAIVDLNPLARTMTTPMTVGVSQYPSSAAVRLWAFVTITNNETQAVTVLRPQ